LVSTQEVPQIEPSQAAASMHVAPLQIGVGSAHAFVHEPQCSPLVVSVSQPFAVALSQSPRPATHPVIAHWPPWHVSVVAF
jgi:hypothetical protein